MGMNTGQVVVTIQLLGPDLKVRETFVKVIDRGYTAAPEVFDEVITAVVECA